MMLHSLPLWHECAARSGGASSLLATTGGLNIAPTGGTGGGPLARELDNLQELYVRRGIAHERLSAAAVNERFGQFGLQPHMEAIFQPDYGVLFASRCVAAGWDYAEELGRHNVTGFRLADVREEEGGIVAVGEDGGA